MQKWFLFRFKKGEDRYYKRIHSCFRAPYLQYYLLRRNCGTVMPRVCTANRDRIDSDEHVLYTMENNLNLVKYDTKQKTYTWTGETSFHFLSSALIALFIKSGKLKYNWLFFNFIHIMSFLISITYYSNRYFFRFYLSENIVQLHKIFFNWEILGSICS